MPTNLKPDATANGTFRIANDLPVHRLGYGAMRVTGEGSTARRTTDRRRSGC